MKILLINPGHDGSHELYKHDCSIRSTHRDPPPIGILYVGTYLHENGYDIDILDTHIHDNYRELILDKIQNNDYLFCGISVIIGKFQKNAEEITRLIKSVKSDLPVVWGGIMASIRSESMLREYSPDYIVRYDGEDTTLELAKALETQSDVSKIDGLAYRDQDEIRVTPPRMPKVDLDYYPVPKWELFGEHFNREQVPYYFSIMSSRGCPFNCSFCYKHSIDQRLCGRIPPWRFRSADHIIKEVSYINSKTKTTVFTFGDDNFIVDKKRALDVLRFFKEQNFYIEECIGHLNCLDVELMEAMAGIVQTFIFSIETASPRLQKILNKKISLSSIPGKMSELLRLGIAPSTNFIIGLPSEDMSDLRANIELMMKLKSIHPYIRGNIYLYLPLPDTKLFDATEELCGVKLRNDLLFYENANMYVKSTFDPYGNAFRPWLSSDKFNMLVQYASIFNDLFQTFNMEPSPQSMELLSGNKDLIALFAGFEDINCPKNRSHLYVLDKVLEGTPIDLLHSFEQ